MDIKEVTQALTLEEKAGLCSGYDFWHTKGVDRLNIPAMMVSDGPHGLRKQDLAGDHLGFNDSIKAVCFPTGATVASSFDRELIYEMGQQLGESCQAENVGVILGPAVNIKRSPLCGRNFEYYSEDPYLTAEMSKKQIKGIQDKGVGTSIKHYLANSQEHRRMTSDSMVDERTLREIYLPAFEQSVKEVQPWTVMCSYNKINGVYASESQEFLTDILRDEWGFEGFVVSDWGAVNDRVEGIRTGLDLEMPSSFGINDQKIVDAVKAGELPLEKLDQAVENILTIVDKYYSTRNEEAVFDLEGQHDKAREIAAGSMVLLKNEQILPLNKKQKVAFIGEFAAKPRYQGGGSSHINVFKETNALDEAANILPKESIVYAKGYDLMADKTDDSLVDEAVKVAQSADVAVLFVGLPDSYESEGYDRSHMRLPESHNYLIDAVTAVQPNTVIVLHNGSPVEMPWINNVKAVLEAYLSGQTVGAATIDILFGDVNPSGKLAESFPVQLEDNPSFIYYLGEKDVVEYREGIFVGYRYYDKKKMNVLFPFGHGLSYTSFEYSNLRCDQDKVLDSESVSVTVDVKNTGDVYGKEVVQLYVSPPKGDVIRAVKELKGFEKVGLAPGETKSVTMTLNKRSFAYYSINISDWLVDTGEYQILVGASSRDIRLETTLEVVSTTKVKVEYTINSTVGDILKDPEKAKVLDVYLKQMEAMFNQEQEGAAQEGESDAAAEAITDEMKQAMFNAMPIRNFITFGGGHVTFEMIQQVLDQLNS